MFSLHSYMGFDFCGESLVTAYDFWRGEMAKQFPYDPNGYVKGKEALAQPLEQKALVWKSYTQIIDSRSRG